MLLRSIQATTTELDPAGQQALVDEALRFRLAGGVLTLTDWATLTQVERDAFVVAATLLGTADAHDGTEPTNAPDVVEAFLDEVTHGAQ